MLRVGVFFASLVLSLHAVPVVPDFDGLVSDFDGHPHVHESFNFAAAEPACNIGTTVVKDNIVFECRSDSASGAAELKPTGCTPDGSGSVTINIGETYANEHFNFECFQNGDVVTLNVLNCIDSTGTTVEIGNFFTLVEDGIHKTIECNGNKTRARKLVHKWTKCELPSGKLLTEGNQHIAPVTVNKPDFQKGEIISCVRNGPNVALKCTGCVSEYTSIHVAVAGYTEVKGQLTQCRRTRDGCRLVKVSSNHLTCRLRGETETHPSGAFFNDSTGVSTYFCQNGHSSKKGCTIDGQWAVVGDVVYNADGEAFLCDSSAGYTSFGDMRGCTWPDGSSKRFQETWNENGVMKRCTWTYDRNGINGSFVVAYACVRSNGEIIPEHKVFQLPNGSYQRCERNANSGRLEIRGLTDSEFNEFIRRKTIHNDIREYYGNGGTAIIAPSVDPEPIASDPLDILPEGVVKAAPGECADLVPFCSKLAGYCPDFDPNEQSQPLTLNASGLTAFQSPCEANFLTGQRKVKMLVDVVCQKTCGSCLRPANTDAIVGKLQQAARC